MYVYVCICIYIEDAMQRDTAAPSCWGWRFCALFRQVVLARKFLLILWLNLGRSWEILSVFLSIDKRIVVCKHRFKNGVPNQQQIHQNDDMIKVDVCYF